MGFFRLIILFCGIFPREVADFTGVEQQIAPQMVRTQTIED